MGTAIDAEMLQLFLNLMNIFKEISLFLKRLLKNQEAFRVKNHKQTIFYSIISFSLKLRLTLWCFFKQCLCFHCNYLLKGITCAFWSWNSSVLNVNQLILSEDD